MSAELDAIAARANERESVTLDHDTGKPIGDAPPAGDPGAAAPQPDPRVVSLAGDIATLLTLIREVVKKSDAYPNTIALYPDEVIGAIAGTAAPLIVKRGWLQGFSVMEKYKEEIGFAMVVAPLTFATMKAAALDIAAYKARKMAEKPAGDETPAPGGEAPADPLQ